MLNEHTGAHNMGARGDGGGKLPNYVKGLLAGVGIAVTVAGAIHNNSVIVGLGLAFTTTVLGLSFSPPGGWLKWLSKALK